MTSAKAKLNEPSFVEDLAEDMITSRSFWADARARFLKNKMAVFSVCMLFGLVLLVQLLVVLLVLGLVLLLP